MGTKERPTSTIVTCRMPVRLKQLAQDAADREGITVSELIRTLLFKHVATPALKGRES